MYEDSDIVIVAHCAEPGSKVAR